MSAPAGTASNSGAATGRSLGLSPTGHAVASDLDITYIAELRKPSLEVRRIDVLDAIEAVSYDLVVARALLHHLTPATKALKRMISALKPGGGTHAIGGCGDRASIAEVTAADRPSELRARFREN